MVTIWPARVSDVSSIARIHIDMWRVAYDGILSGEYLRRLSYSRSRIQWQSFLDRHAGVLLVADSTNDGVVGFAAGGAERSGQYGVEGEMMALYVLASHHGNGIGRRLTEDMARRLASHGRTGMLVWVLAENSATGFYEHIGGDEVASRLIKLGDESHQELAYVWMDISDLLE